MGEQTDRAKRKGTSTGDGTTEVACLYCLKDGGVLGERAATSVADDDGQVTFFAEEVFADLCKHLGIRNRAPSGLRRNVVSTGVNWSELIGREFEINGVRFLATGTCQPSDTMNAFYGKGTQAFLEQRGGLRARILTDGWLRPGPTELIVWPDEFGR